MGLLYEYGLVKSQSAKAASIFEELFPDFLSLPLESPKDYITACWDQYVANYPRQGVETNGKYFELCLGTLLIRQNLLPFYVGARVTFVPNVKYDFIFYLNRGGPICISAKTSLRERYKQADLEAIALKNVHRKSESYLITLNEQESKLVKKKIIAGEVIALNDAIYAKSDELDRFIGRLKTLSLTKAPTISVVESDRIVTGKKKMKYSSSSLRTTCS